MTSLGMKRFVQGVANRFGCRISRIQNEHPEDDPFWAMKNLLKGVESAVIFDVGAHHGCVAQRFRRLFPNSTVYAFEPFLGSFQILKENTGDDPGIYAFDFGLADRPGLKTFYSNQSSATNSLLATDEKGAQTWGVDLLETHNIIEANFQTLDTVVRMKGITTIDILKLDVQGAEPLVMAGAIEACRSKMVQVIYSEIIIQPTYSGQMRLDKLLGTYYDLGFDLYDVYNLSRTDKGFLRQVDAIFVRLGR
jgi:FkbM family methyltransferase